MKKNPKVYKNGVDLAQSIIPGKENKTNNNPPKSVKMGDNAYINLNSNDINFSNDITND
ncbi:MAG: hypothetical protein ACOCRK_03940 [bacterium]